MKIVKLIVFIILLVLCSTLWASEDVEANSKTDSIKHKCPDTPPKPIEIFPPRYQYVEGMKSTEGKVTVSFTITTEGVTRDIEVIEAYPEGVFEEAAIRAVKQYRFKPATKDCKPVDCIVNMPIVFDARTNSLYDYDKAIEIGKKRIANKEFEKAIAYVNRGYAYNELKNSKNACADFQKACDLENM